jgi:hypothetical protein
MLTWGQRKIDVVQKEFKWAKLIQAEYKEQFPDLPFQEQFECTKIME